MNIFTITEKDSWIDDHIITALRNMGHSVYNYYYGQYVGEFYGIKRRKERSEKNELLRQKLDEVKITQGIDLIFSYVYDDFLNDATGKKIQSLNVPSLNYNVDMVGQWYRQTKTASYFSHILCAQQINMDCMSRFNKNVVYFPMASNSDPSSTDIPKQRDGDSKVRFIGTCSPYRKAVLSSVSKNNIDVEVYGKNWSTSQSEPSENSNTRVNIEKRLRDAVSYTYAKYWLGRKLQARVRKINNCTDKGQHADTSDSTGLHNCGRPPSDQLTELFRTAAINIGITRMIGEFGCPGINQMKLRDIEVPMAGGFYLAEKSPDLAYNFKVGEEVEVWETVDELIEKTRYYLDNPEKAQAIAVNGQARALSEHTWEKRFNNLFTELGLV
jgi:hypothetical protein